MVAATPWLDECDTALHVPSEYATIQGAIDASSNGDVIAIAAGTYYEHSLNPSGKAITIGSASGNLDVTIDAQQGGIVFVIDSGEGEGTVIKDLVITGGIASGPYPSYYGGGIDCNGSNPTITGCTISGNTASGSGDYSWLISGGGGIYCGYSSPTISNCTISGNTASGSDAKPWQNVGGGIYCEHSNTTIINCTISGNTATLGGGIYCNDGSSPTISGCTISGNTAVSGGGIYCYDSDGTIIDCTISDNTAYHGGGITCRHLSRPTITNCTISGNTAYDVGGGIWCWTSRPTITNCTIEGNTVDSGGGGGIACVGENPTISDSQICGNTPNQISGSYTDGGGNNVADECPLEGACCVGSSCSVVTEYPCMSAGGTFLGDDTDCSGTDPCDTVLHVPSEYATIQAAIDASANGDVIAIEAGTYYEHSLNTSGKAITIGSASGNLDVTIDAQQDGERVRVLTLAKANGTVIQDLVITGGILHLLRRRDLLHLQQPHHHRLHDHGQHGGQRRRDLLLQQQQPHHQRLHDLGQHGLPSGRRDLLLQQ